MEETFNFVEYVKRKDERIEELENLLKTFKSMFEDSGNDLYLEMIKKVKL